MVVEAQREVDFESLDPATDLTDHDTEQGAFEDFVQRARAALPIKEQNVDVYIGWWGNQTTFVIPQEFFHLITETKWPVSFDINFDIND
jgi:hypothetical protein